MNTGPVLPSGEQYEITAGEQRAVIVEVGGGVRVYEIGDRPVLEPYPENAMCDGAHGAPLIPWPNRLGDGRYEFAGKQYQVALTEPEKNNAIHGFLRWRPWTALERGADRMVMGTRLYPMTGYPFSLEVRIDYRLSADGLTVSTTATNIGDQPCPYACGQHPYLYAGGGLLDDCTLLCAAATRIDTDEQRQLPTAREPVDGTDFDFRRRRRIGDVAVDFTFTDLERDADGRAWAHLAGPDGCTARLWVDETYPFLELFTGDTLASKRRRRGLGTEPMTCPPNGLQSGEGVHSLAPQQSVTTTWGASLA